MQRNLFYIYTYCVLYGGRAFARVCAVDDAFASAAFFRTSLPPPFRYQRRRFLCLCPLFRSSRNRKLTEDWFIGGDRGPFVACGGGLYLGSPAERTIFENRWPTATARPCSQRARTTTNGTSLLCSYTTEPTRQMYVQYATLFCSTDDHIVCRSYQIRNPNKAVLLSHF